MFLLFSAIRGTQKEAFRCRSYLAVDYVLGAKCRVLLHNLLRAVLNVVDADFGPTTKAHRFTPGHFTHAPRFNQTVNPAPRTQRHPILQYHVLSRGQKASHH